MSVCLGLGFPGLKSNGGEIVAEGAVGKEVASVGRLWLGGYCGGEGGGRERKGWWWW